MRSQNKTITVISIVYVAALALFLRVSYIVTDGGVGWDFFTALIIALLSIPLYISLISLLRALENLCPENKSKPPQTKKFEKTLSIVSLCLVALSLLCLGIAAVSMVTHIKNDFIRQSVLPLSFPILICCCVGNFAFLLCRPISKLIDRLKRKNN